MLSWCILLPGWCISLLGWSILLFRRSGSGRGGLLGCLLLLLSLLVSRSAHGSRYSGLFPGCQPVCVLLDAFALGFPVDVKSASVTGRCGVVDSFRTGGRFGVRRVGFEAVSTGEPAQSIVERIELLNFFRGTPLRCSHICQGSHGELLSVYFVLRISSKDFATGFFFRKYSFASRCSSMVASRFSSSHIE